MDRLSSRIRAVAGCALILMACEVRAQSSTPAAQPATQAAPASTGSRAGCCPGDDPPGEDERSPKHFTDAADGGCAGRSIGRCGDPGERGAHGRAAGGGCPDAAAAADAVGQGREGNRRGGRQGAEAAGSDPERTAYPGCSGAVADGGGAAGGCAGDPGE